MKALDTKYRFLIGALAFFASVPTLRADLLQEGREAFLNYDFDLASELYEKYARSLKKTPNSEKESLLETYVRQLEIAQNSLENVQKIEVIDRIDVPVDDFFKHVRLPASGGRLLEPNASVLKNRNNQSDFAYSSEAGDVMMWSETDESGHEHIMQSERLMDGSWERPHMVGDILNDGGNARNPFLLTDGITLYFSSDGEGSMGGYDLFVASKDPVSGVFRQPLGVGYPFNSPFNEYMMAIDEDNGIGWWVTDRNRLDGRVSVYVFKTNDVRKNYVMDEEEDIVSLARLEDITVTQSPDIDYRALSNEIVKRSEILKSGVGVDFSFPMSQGRVARHLSDFKSSEAKRLMQQYLQASAEYGKLERRLSDLRKQYHVEDRKKGSSAAIRNQILDLEKKRDQESERLKTLRNSIITAETN